MTDYAGKKSFTKMLDRYNAGVEPLSVTTRDIARLVELLDTELQQRAFRRGRSLAHFLTGEIVRV